MKRKNERTEHKLWEEAKSFTGWCTLVRIRWEEEYDTNDLGKNPIGDNNH